MSERLKLYDTQPKAYAREWISQADMSLLATALDERKFSKTIRATSTRQRVFDVLERGHRKDRLSRCVDVLLIVLIALSTVAIILESVDSLYTAYGEWFFRFEAFTVSVFSAEYLLRVWSCSAGLRGPEAIKHRLKHITSPAALIDLLAILPFYLMLGGQIDMRFLRMLRLVRVFKLTRYSAAFDILGQAFAENSRSLTAAFFVLLMVMLVAATGMYFFEQDAQPEAFSSIPAAMWWAFTTLTTVGYGDVVPITSGGRIFGAFITVLGIGMVALPTGILASAYTEQLRRRSEHYRRKADAALSDGILSSAEAAQLEKLRKNLGLDKNSASEILELEQRRTDAAANTDTCPHCGGKFGAEHQPTLTGFS